MRSMSLIVGVVVLLSGCQHVQLREHTVRQASTLTDTQYQIVLDNMAMLCSNPDVMPYGLYANGGTTNIQLTGQANVNPTWDLLNSMGRVFHWKLDKVASTVTGTDQMVEQWTSVPISNPEELILMRCIYLRALASPKLDKDCEDRLNAFFAHDDSILKGVGEGWYGTGGRHDVPKGACHVGHCGDCYLWVMPDGLLGLTNLTLAILDVATAQPPFPHDLLTSKIIALEAQAKTLGDLYKSTDGTSAASVALKKELELVLVNLTEALAAQRKGGVAVTDTNAKIKAPPFHIYRKPLSVIQSAPINIPVP